MDHAIATENLTRRFGRLEAVHDLTLQVPAGSIFGLIGPNGAGKTTTLKVLMNIMRPTAGRASVLGVDSRQLAPAQFAQIGYVSENQQLPAWMTVRELLAYCRPFYPTWDEALAARLVDLLDLPLDRRIKHLSRGMRMKAALVSSLAYRPKLLILDEPFSGLDALMRDEFVQGILELAGEGGWSAVISSHDLEEIERLIDWVGYLRQGRLAFAESVADLQARFRQIEITLPEREAASTTGASGATDAAAGAAGASVVGPFEPRPEPTPASPPLSSSPGPRMPEPMPAAWLNVTTSGRTIGLVHSRYVPGETERELLARFPGAQIQSSPLSLRETFIALARQDRGRATTTEARMDHAASPSSPSSSTSAASSGSPPPTTGDSRVAPAHDASNAPGAGDAPREPGEPGEHGAPGAGGPRS